MPSPSDRSKARLTSTDSGSRSERANARDQEHQRHRGRAGDHKESIHVQRSDLLRDTEAQPASHRTMRSTEIERAEVIVTSPGRNFVTLRLTTTDGVQGVGDATVN